METEMGTDTRLGIQPLEPDHARRASLMESPKFRPPHAAQSCLIFDQGYLARLRSGDEETAKHFNSYFRRVLRIKLWAKFCRQRQDDLIDEVMAAAMQKILSGEPRDATCLAAYVRGICANLTKKPNPTNHGVDLNFEQLSDRTPSAEERLLAEERARTVRAVLVTLKPRDHDTLVDLFYNDLTRNEVCEKYGVSREQLRLVLFRARTRFQEKWEKQSKGSVAN
jgi:RNA polymerase sigma factor (sigma-70 family)